MDKTKKISKKRLEEVKENLEKDIRDIFKKKYEIIYEVVKQYRVEIQADTEALAKQKWENGEFRTEDVEDMEDIAPYEQWNDNKNIVEINQLN